MEREEDSLNVFEASVPDVRPIASMLRAISFKGALRATVEIRDRGTTFTVEEGRSVQAHAYLQPAAFETYIVNASLPSTPSNGSLQPTHDNGPPAAASFEISLPALLECLNIFGNAAPISTSAPWTGKGRTLRADGDEDGDDEYRRGYGSNKRPAGGAGAGGADSSKMTAAHFLYGGVGYPLVILLEDGGIVTRCEMTTYEPELLMDLMFDDRAKVQKAIMKSEWLRDAFSEMDPSAETITILFSPPGQSVEGVRAAQSNSQPTFRLKSSGMLGSTQMDFPNDKDVIETFECNRLISNSYKFGHLRLTEKALQAASKVSIRTDGEGLVSFQFMIPLGKTAVGPKDGFVEFICLPIATEG